MAVPMRMRPKKGDWMFVLHDGALPGMPAAFMGEVMAVPFPGVQHDDEVWAWIYQKNGGGPIGEAALAIMRRHIVAWAIVPPPP